MIDYTKVKPEDRFRVTKESIGAPGGSILIAGDQIDPLGFRATDGWWYLWERVEPVADEAALITRPIEGMPEWLASTPKGVAVKCRVKHRANGHWYDTPRWVLGYSAKLFMCTDGPAYPYAEPWTEPEAEQDIRAEQEIRAELTAATELVRTLQVELAQLRESDARYRRKDA